MSKIETRGVYLYTDTASAQKSYDILVDKNKKLQKELFELKKAQLQYVEGVRAGNTTARKEYAKLEAEIEKVRAKYDASASKMKAVQNKINGTVGQSFKEMRDEANHLMQVMDSMPINSPEWDKAKANYDAANKKLQNYGITLGTIKTKLKQVASEVGTIAIGTMVGSVFQSALMGMQSYFQGILDSAIKTSDELTNIEKTTDLTGAQVDEFSSKIGELDVRTPTSELRQLGEEGGKLGKGDSIAGLTTFVKKANEIKLALGDDLGADAVISISKASKQFNIDMENMASGVNSVGQASEATEKYQIDFLSRLAGLGNIANITAGDIMGLGAVLEMSGQQTEMAGTAVQKIVLDLIKDTESFGKAAGMANGELSKIAQEQGYNEALLVFIERLKAGSVSQADFLKKMEAVGINGERGASVFLALASKIKDVRVQQKLANEEVEKGTSVSEEAEKRNTNLAATYEKFIKRLNAFKNSGVLKGLFIDAIKSADDFLDVISKIPTWLSRNTNLLIVLATAYLVYNGNMIKATLSTIANSVATAYNTAVQTAQNIAYSLGMTIVNAYTASQVRGTIVTRALAAAQYLWNAALNANPIGVVIVAVVALTTAIAKMITYVKDATKVEYAKEQMSYRVAKANAIVEASMKSLNDQVKKYNTLNYEQRDALRANIKAQADKLKMDIASMEMEQKKIALAARHLSYYEEQNIRSKGYQDFATSKGLKVEDVMTPKYDAEYTKFVSNKVELAKDKKGAEATADNLDQINKLKDSLKELGNMYFEVRPAMEIYAEAMKIQTLTTEDYETKMNLLRDAQKRAVVGSKDYLTITAEITKLQKEAATLANSAGTGENIESKEAKKAKKSADELAKFKQELEATMQKLKLAKEDPYTQLFAEIDSDIESLLEHAREFGSKEFPALERVIKLLAQTRKTQGIEELDKQAIQDGYQEALKYGDEFHKEQITRAKQSKAALLIDEESYQDLVADLELQSLNYKIETAKSYELAGAITATADKLNWQADYEDKSLLQLERHNRKKRDIAKEALKQKYDDEINNAYSNLYAAQLAGNQQAISDARIAIIEAELKKELELVEHTENEKRRLRGEADVKIQDVKSGGSGGVTGKKYAWNEMNTQQKTQKVIEEVTFMTNLMGDYYRTLNEYENRDLENFKRSNDEKANAFKHQLDNKQITQAEYDAQIHAMNEAYDQRQLALRRKQFKRDQGMRIAEAIMQTASGAVGALSQALATYPPPAGPIIGGIEAAAMGVFGALKIANISKERPPSYGGGGELANGPKHSDTKTGGLWVINPYTGELEAKVERGEFIVNNDSYQANRDLVHAINDSRGKPLVMSLPAYQRPIINTTRAIENIQYANGGVIGQARYDAITSNNTASNDLSVYDQTLALTQELKKQTTEIKNINKKAPVISLSEVKKADKKNSYYGVIN